MPRNRTGNPRIRTNWYGDTIAPGPSGGFIESPIGASIHSICEALSGSDGLLPRMKKIRFHLRCYLTDVATCFSLASYAVQTAGTVTDTINQGARVDSELLDAAIDDVFGYHPLNPIKVSRLAPDHDGSTTNGRNQMIEVTFELPGHLIQLLNKELETERLQDLFLVNIGVESSNSAETIEFLLMVELHYTLVRKNIIVR